MDNKDDSENNLDIETDKSDTKMVEIKEEHTVDNWDGGSYSEAMKKFRDTCIAVKRKDKCIEDSEDEKEKENVGDNNRNCNRSIDGKDSIDKCRVIVEPEFKDSCLSERKSFVPDSKEDKENDIEERCSPNEKICWNRDLTGKENTKYQGRETTDSVGNQLTEKNLKMFTKMQYFPYNLDMSKTPNDMSRIDLRYKYFKEAKRESCPSADSSVNESHDGRYDSENDLISNNSHNPKLMKSLMDSKTDMMRFAELLYKCTLCTSIPSIFTSKSSFVKHIRANHFSVESQFKVCNICCLKFKTDEDLRRHVLCIHTGSDRVSPVETGSDVIRPDFCNNAGDNESDSDSSGHRSYKAKVVKRSKPQVSDFDNPKQLVDHAGIETLNGSLDLSKKELKPTSNICDTKTNLYKTPQERSSPHSLNEKNALNVQQITDQIIQSNLHGRNIGSQSEQRLPFTPSYTPEFGKYTKLVREGGNIVYFCQVCNWMSPVKAHFQAHCGAVSHSKKVKSTNEQEQGSDSKLDTSANKDGGSQSRSPNVCIGGFDMKYGAGPHPSILNIPNTSTFSKLHEASLFYSYIRPRTLNHCGRTPVVSGQGFQERSDIMYQKQVENSGLSINNPYRKRKRPASSKTASGTTFRQCISESDSDDMSGDKENPSLCSSANMSLLRSKLLQGHGRKEKTCPGSVRDENYSIGESHLKSELSERLDSQADKSEKCEYREDNFTDESAINKRKTCDESPADRGLSAEKHRKMDESELSDRRVPVNDGDHSLFKLYRCMSCPFEYSNLEEYERHFSKMHVASGQGEGSPKGTYQRLYSGMGSTQQGQTEGQSVRTEYNGGGGNMEMGENWRVQKLKEILPDFLEVNEKGNTSRDFLLQCICISCAIPDAALWSSACNKAVREVFPSSMAQRKGKYKKTYYFGLSMAESFQGQEDFNPLDPEGQIYQPIRDINADMEKIMEQLPTIIHWNGCMDSGVYRADILSVLEDILEEPDVLSWGTQCNRAIKLVFPMVDMKRKGKFKTTKYFGVSFNKNIGQVPGKPDCNSSIADMPNPKEDKQEKETGDEHEDSSRETTQIQTITKNNNPSKFPTREPADSENFGSMVPVFPQWFKEEAQSQMEQYLTKFGGVFDTTNGKNSNKNEDDDNDGDDEGESIDETTSV